LIPLSVVFFAYCFVITDYRLMFAEVHLGTWRTRTKVWETRISGSSAQSLRLNGFAGPNSVGVVSYGTLGHLPPSISNNLIFSS